MGPFICDFVSRAAKLVIEIDGDTHAHQAVYDAKRTEFLEREGYRVLRFSNNEVMQNLEGVVSRIATELADRPSPDPSRTREGRMWGSTVRWTREP